jgi:hypothetical protein
MLDWLFNVGGIYFAQFCLLASIILLPLAILLLLLQGLVMLIDAIVRVVRKARS